MWLLDRKKEKVLAKILGDVFGGERALSEIAFTKRSLTNKGEDSYPSGVWAEVFQLRLGLEEIV